MLDMSRGKDERIDRAKTTYPAQEDRQIREVRRINVVEYLYAVIDYGSSALKVFYSTELTDTPQYFTMQPEIIEVSVDDVREYRKNFNLDPARNAFVGTKDRYYDISKYH